MKATLATHKSGGEQRLIANVADSWHSWGGIDNSIIMRVATGSDVNDDSRKRTATNVADLGGH